MGFLRYRGDFLKHFLALEKRSAPWRRAERAMRNLGNLPESLQKYTTIEGAYFIKSLFYRGALYDCGCTL